MSAPRIVLVGLSVLLGACAGRQAPSLQRYTLGMGRAEYRDYSGARADLCDSEPRWLADELSSVNGLLSRFLSSTEEATKPQALHHAEHLALLQEATRSLGPVMEIHRQNLAALRECGFQGTGAFPDIALRGAELLERAKARLADSSGALAAAELQRAQQAWAEEAPAREATARRTWCASSPKLGNADLYFARQYPNGRTEWLFCDGLMVEEAAGGTPQLITPEWINRKERRRIQPQRYLDAAKNYPASDIDRQPSSSPGSGAISKEQASRVD
jgi:hypothetical protein